MTQEVIVRDKSRLLQYIKVIVSICIVVLSALGIAKLVQVSREKAVGQRVRRDMASTNASMIQEVDATGGFKAVLDYDAVGYTLLFLAINVIMGVIAHRIGRLTRLMARSMSKV